MDANPVLLNTLLEAVARQLRVLRDSGYAIEHAVGDLISSGTGVSGPLYGSLQRLDHLVQSLDGIADYLEHLIEDIAPDVALDPQMAARQIKQRDLAAALVGNARASPADGGHGAGEAQFF